MTQRELASRAGVGIRALRDIEHGRVGRPRPGTVRALASALALTDADLLPPAAGHDARARPALLSVDVLGPVSADLGPTAVDLNSPMQRSLLGLLALHANQVVSRDEIVDALWGGRPPRTSTTMVHVTVGQLRALLDPAWRRGTAPRTIVLVRNGYRLDVDEARLDVTRFAALDAAARQALAAGNGAAAMTFLDQALACWRGPALADVRPAVRQHPTIVALARHRTRAVLTHADLAIAAGLHDLAIIGLHTMLRDEPLHEGLAARLIRALAGHSEQAAALRIYNQIRQRLDEELGVRPGAELRAAYLAVLRQEAA